MARVETFEVLQNPDSVNRHVSAQCGKIWLANMERKVLDGPRSVQIFSIFARERQINIVWLGILGLGLGGTKVHILKHRFSHDGSCVFHMFLCVPIKMKQNENRPAPWVPRPHIPAHVWSYLSICFQISHIFQ